MDVITERQAGRGPDHEIRAFAIGEMSLEQRDDGGDLRLSGHAAVFDRETDLGWGFSEVIRPGAFSRAIAEGQDVALLFNHDPSTVMARTTNKTLTLGEDDIGLAFSADLDARDSDAQRVVTKVERGNVTQGSFAFDVRQERWTHREGAQPLRELLDLDLYDVSPVTYPAYSETNVQARGRVVVPPTLDVQEDDSARLTQERERRQRRRDRLSRRVGVVIMKGS